VEAMGRSSRSWFSMLDLLPPAQRRAYLELKGYPPDWEPPPLEWQGRQASYEGLESRDELERMMPLPPGFTSLADFRRAVRGRKSRRRT
jgi:hypothetical protein